MSLYIQVCIERILVCDFLVDTGATLSLLTKEVFDLLPLPYRQLHQTGSIAIRQADGSPMTVLGKVVLKITINGVSVQQVFWVTDFSERAAGILGMDFLRQHNCLLDLGKGSRKFGGEMQLETLPRGMEWLCKNLCQGIHAHTSLT